MERYPAIKCSIKEIVEGKFYSGDRENLRPSFVLTKYGEKISRVNIFGTITDKFVSESGNYLNLTINDFSGAIRVKYFGNISEITENLDVGDNVIIIGKPRLWNGEIYINLEIIRKVDDPNFENYRKVEILKKIVEKKKIINELHSLREKLNEESFLSYVQEKYGFSPEEVKFILESREEKRDFKYQVLKVIKELDRGDGIDVLDIFNSLNIQSSILDSILTELIREGRIEEVEPGKIRVRI